MRIETLDESTKSHLLKELLRRSPDNYGKYEAGVQEILSNVRENGTRPSLPIRKNLTG